MNTEGETRTEFGKYVWDGWRSPIYAPESIPERERAQPQIKIVEGSKNIVVTIIVSREGHGNSLAGRR